MRYASYAMVKAGSHLPASTRRSAASKCWRARSSDRCVAAVPPDRMASTSPRVSNISMTRCVRGSTSQRYQRGVTPIGEFRSGFGVGLSAEHGHTGGMDILFVAGFAPIAPDPGASRAFYADVLNLPLEVVSGDYLAVDGFEGTKHLGVWPLADAAQSCFGTPDWPAEVPVPQATIEFEVADVAASAAELEAAGLTLVHATRTEPWGQTIARLLGPEGLLIGVCHTPWLHAPEGDASAAAAPPPASPDA